MSPTYSFKLRLILYNFLLKSLDLTDFIKMILRHCDDHRIVTLINE